MKTLNLTIALMLIFAGGLFGQSQQDEEKKDRKIEINFGDDDDDHDHDHDHDDDDDDDDDDHKKGKLRFGMLDLGISSYLAEDTGLNMPEEYSQLDQRLGRSIHLGIHAINAKLGLNGKGKPQYVGISTGLRFNLNHYSFENDFNLRQDEESFLAAIDTDVDAQRKNRLYASYLVIPAMIELNTNPSEPSKSFNLAFGYTYHILLASNQKTKGEDGLKVKTKDDFSLSKNLGMVEARIGYGALNFFVQYGLNELFKPNTEPSVTPINFGVNIIPR